MSKTIESQDLETRAQAIAEALAQAAEEAAERAHEAWRETQPARKEAARTLERQGREIGKWTRHVWRHDIRPGLRRAWNRRTVAIGAAGAAVPAMIEDAASELGLRPRHERHWMAFLVGIAIGAVTGVVIAILTAPKSGAETREEIAVKAREAADAAGEWIPVNVPSGNGNGDAIETAPVADVPAETPKASKASEPTEVETED
jgi:gas vesicle protein